MTIWEASKKLSAILHTIYEKREAEKITEMVVENVTGFSRSERLIYRNNMLSPGQLEKFENYSAELLLHKPVQYVLHETWFAGLKFYVDENVLIPRPETEELVEWVINNLSASQNQLPTKILDIGTGSGCIAVLLKIKLHSSLIYALDISNKSLSISKKNATLNNADIDFFKADILKIDPKIPFQNLM